MASTEISLIKITANDLTSLQVISKQTFFETFAESNTKEDIEHFLNTGYTDEKLLSEINNPDSLFYFARLNHENIGFLKLNFGQAQSELKDKKSLEVERIYVLKEFQGKKAGQFLFDKAIEIAKDHKLEYLWLGVWEKNEKAIRFYEKNGLFTFGKHLFLVGKDEQTDIMMKLVLID